MSTDTVSEQQQEEPIAPGQAEEPTEVAQEEQPQEDAASSQEAEEKAQNVPLSALQKERRKRQEAEEELRYYREQKQQQQQSEDEYEMVSKADLGKSKQEIIRAVEERNWIKNNPEKAAEVEEKLSEFLKQRPNITSAIESAPNRYEEAWQLMNALTPKQQAALKNPPSNTPKKEGPGNPASVPKAAGINQGIDLMSMSDKEFNEWRKSKIKRR